MSTPDLRDLALVDVDGDRTRLHVQADAVPSFEKQGIGDRYDRAAQSFRLLFTEPLYWRLIILVRAA
jgi:hypothetical protein